MLDSDAIVFVITVDSPEGMLDNATLVLYSYANELNVVVATSVELVGIVLVWSEFEL